MECFIVRAIFYLKRGGTRESCYGFRAGRLKKALDSAVDGMSNQQLRWHPADKWSAAEVLEHLYLTYTGTIRGFEKLRASGGPLATRGSLKHRVRAWVVVGFGHMPEGRKAPAATLPKGFAPEKIRLQLGKKLSRWIRSSQNVRSASGAASNCSTIRFSAR